MKQRIRTWLLPACAAQLLAGAALAQAPPAPGAVAAPAASAPAADGIEPRVNTSAPAPRAPVKGTRPAAARGNADRIDLDSTQITGNRELPKVLYIVPWKRPELGDLIGRPLNSLLDEVLAPVDRDVFRRENRYFNALQAGGDKPAPAPAAAPAAGSGAAGPGAATVPGSTPQPVPEPKPES